MEFVAYLSEPVKKDFTIFADVQINEVMELFEKNPWLKLSWLELFEKTQTAEQHEIHRKPVLQILQVVDWENKFNNPTLFVGPKDGGWTIAYIRPKISKKFFGLKKVTNRYVKEANQQTENDVRDCLKAFMRNDLQFLEDKITGHDSIMIYE